MRAATTGASSTCAEEHGEEATLRRVRRRHARRAVRGQQLDGSQLVERGAELAQSWQKSSTADLGSRTTAACARAGSGWSVSPAVASRAMRPHSSATRLGAGTAQRQRRHHHLLTRSRRAGARLRTRSRARGFVRCRHLRLGRDAGGCSTRASSSPDGARSPSRGSPTGPSAAADGRGGRNAATPPGCRAPAPPRPPPRSPTRFAAELEPAALLHCLRGLARRARRACGAPPKPLLAPPRRSTPSSRAPWPRGVARPRPPRRGGVRPLNASTLHRPAVNAPPRSSAQRRASPPSRGRRTRGALPRRDVGADPAPRLRLPRGASAAHAARAAIGAAVPLPAAAPASQRAPRIRRGGGARGARGAGGAPACSLSGRARAAAAEGCGKRRRVCVQGLVPTRSRAPSWARCTAAAGARGRAARRGS